MSAMKVKASKTYTGKLWHIRGINGKALCGKEIRDFTKELEITDKRVCRQCKEDLFKLLSRKKKINEILKVALP